MADINPDKDHIACSIPLFAEIIIPLALPKNYTWRIPSHLSDKVKAGCRAEVVLGRNKKYAGIIKQLHHNKPVAFEPKDILNVLDAEPIVFEQVRLWERIAHTGQRGGSDVCCPVSIAEQ